MSSLRKQPTGTCPAPGNAQKSVMKKQTAQQMPAIVGARENGVGGAFNFSGCRRSQMRRNSLPTAGALRDAVVASGQMGPSARVTLPPL